MIPIKHREAIMQHYYELTPWLSTKINWTQVTPQCMHCMYIQWHAKTPVQLKQHRIVKIIKPVALAIIKLRLSNGISQ